MLYRIMPRTNRKLSILGFGCMRLPVDNNCNINEALAGDMVHRAIEAGINYFDTAYPYHSGQSEPFLGRALSGGNREKVNLATKLPTWLVNSRPEFNKYLNEQLDRLQTDHIDFYLIHGLNKESWTKIKELGVADFLDSAIQDGRIIFAGFSFHDDLATFKEIVDSYNWTFCQIQYNFIDEKYQAGAAGLDYAHSKGIGIIAMEPLRGGMLTKKIPGLVKVWSDSSVKRIPAEWGLRWVWNNPNVTTVLSGMSTPQQLKENLKFAEKGLPGSLSQRDLKIFDKVRSFYRSKMAVNCTGCRYCTPCPNGVDIPECFGKLNDALLFDEVKRANTAYKKYIVAEGGGAELCTSCLTCMELCPQHIDIPEKLKTVSKYFGKLPGV